MPYQTISQHKPSPRHGATHVDIITYRHGGGMMYVPVAESYSQAIAHARNAFSPLKQLQDSAITLSLNVINGTHRQSVGITAAAWPKIILHLSRYEVIDIHTTVDIPSITITGTSECEAAPAYRGPDSHTYDEKAPSSSHPTDRNSRTSSPTPGPTAGKLSPRWIMQKLHGSLSS
ncbi:hypothetical protein PAXRUDRAFT_832774 [Paxillus rubicundulus Ve08.2h10]|uniref:Uncharacterized protein n=1 Tax=Paxillus rubicundulus Ve08.2h10 TaxID=930991 RepID=A0A0D0D0M9_9AGAM|nr:hypothetical protein PAXRUDRAFT_832774 [Paxillus rubicundulus Ve08.2h10]